MTTKTRLVAVLAVLGVFVAGGVTGAALARLSAQRTLHDVLEGGAPEQFEARALTWTLDRQIDLDPAQRERVFQVIQTHHPAMAEQRLRIEPEIRALWTAQYDEIRGLLRPDQIARFDEVAGRFERSRRRASGATDDPVARPAPR